MSTLAEDMRAMGGAATRTQLTELGWSHREIRAAVGRGELTRLTRSWVGAPQTPEHISTALGLHGLVGGAAALRSYGVWVAEHPEPVVSFARKQNLPSMPPTLAHCRGSGRPDARHPWRVPAHEAFAQYARITTEYWAVAALDSALHNGVLLAEDVRDVAPVLNRRRRRWLQRADRRAESGLETILRLACLDQGWDVAVQARVPGGRVDLVINGWLYIEIDGSEFHDVAEQAKKDRHRNNTIVRLGGRWHRFSYRDIRYELPRSIETIRILLRQGRPPQSRPGSA